MLNTVFGIYESEGSFGGENLPDVTVDELLNNDDVEAAYEENSIDTAARLVYENTYNWNTIVEASEIEELHVLEATGTMAITEATQDGFLGKVKEFFKKLWEKVQQMFKKALMQFAVFAKSDKEFLSKYKKDIYKAMNTKNFGDVQFSGYNYLFLTKGVDEITTPIKAADEYTSVETAASDIFGVTYASIDKEALEKIDADKVTESLDDYRKKFCKSTTSVTASEFKESVLEYLQGDTTKDTKDLGDWITPAMAFLEGSKKIETTLNTLLKDNKANIQKSIKTVESAQKLLSKALSEKDKTVEGLQHQLTQKVLNVLQAQRSIEVQYNGIALQALKQCSRQCKAVCVKVVSTKTQNASTAYGESAGILSGIRLI